MAKPDGENKAARSRAAAVEASGKIQCQKCGEALSTNVSKEAICAACAWPFPIASSKEDSGLTRIVETSEELKTALSGSAREIIIADPALAKKVRAVKGASKGLMIATVGLIGAAALAWWNPIGWTAAAGAVAVEGAVAAGFVGTGVAAEGALLAAVTFLVTALGAGVVWSLWNEWDIEATGEVVLPTGVKVKGGVKLRPNR